MSSTIITIQAGDTVIIQQRGKPDVTLTGIVILRHWEWYRDQFLSGDPSLAASDLDRVEDYGYGQGGVS